MGYPHAGQSPRDPNAGCVSASCAITAQDTASKPRRFEKYQYDSGRVRVQVFVFGRCGTFQAGAGNVNRSFVRALLSAFLQSQFQLLEFALGQHGNPHGIGPLNAGAGFSMQIRINATTRE
jgi:hypothetical protein